MVDIFYHDNTRTVKYGYKGGYFYPPLFIFSCFLKSLLDRILVNTKYLQFYYDKDNIVLDNLNITFEKGKLIGIVGESGCGKSTLLKLLLGLYDSKKGKVSIKF
ncbi:MAG: ATP-binding cassette domain-containing protein, partial [Clostridia bacterium]|nr:ATP-binding cassette domain-containing protein [Clostridia bacterium]